MVLCAVGVSRRMMVPEAPASSTTRSIRAWRRISTRKAAVAVARKLSVILYRMLRDSSEFRWSEGGPRGMSIR